MLRMHVNKTFLAMLLSNLKRLRYGDQKTSGESLFLRNLVLGTRVQASGKNLTRLVNAFGAPIRPRHLVPTQQGVGT